MPTAQYMSPINPATDKEMKWYPEMYHEIFLDSERRPIDRIRLFFDRHLAIYEDHLEYKFGCVMGNFSIEMSDVNEQFQALLNEEFNKCEDVIAQCLQEGQEKGEIPLNLIPKQQAAFILNAWHGALLRMKSTANAKPLEDCKEMVLNHLLK